MLVVLALKKISQENKTKSHSYAEFLMHVPNVMAMHSFNGGSQSGCCLHQSLITTANQID